jgi:manganese transport protein
VYILWVLAEIAIAATDLAEIIGSATALNLLFNIPLWAGVIITSVDVLFIIAFGMKNFRVLEVWHAFSLCDSRLSFLEACRSSSCGALYVDGVYP